MMAPLWSWQQPEDVVIVRRVPRDGWFVWLLRGWSLPDGAHAQAASHLVYDVRMWRRG